MSGMRARGAAGMALGGMMLFFLVTLLMNKFLFPRVVHFLDSRAAIAAGNPKSSRRRTR